MEKPLAENSARPLRSYVRREGRLTTGQRRALQDLWPQYGLSLPLTSPLASWFHRAAPTQLEIGFGDGEALLDLAEKNPERNFIGVEVHRPGVGRLLLQLHARQLTHVRVFCEDGVGVLSRAIPEQSLEAIHLYFPDPWPKKKHHKRRLIQAAFLNLIAAKLQPGGRFYFVTDWRPYAIHTRDLLDSCRHFRRLDEPGDSPPRAPTKFERRGQRLGHEIHDLVMER